VNERICCICEKTFKPVVLYLAPSEGDGCPTAPVICKSCRRLPEALKFARELLAEHMKKHHNDGYFVPAYSHDPWHHYERIEHRG
jgi:hypothetical protein